MLTVIGVIVWIELAARRRHRFHLQRRQNLAATEAELHAELICAILVG